MRGVYPIQSVSLRTGLSVHVIRAWERRYGVVHPDRIEGRRLYSESDVLRLSLLRKAVDGGRRIGAVSGLSTEELQRLLASPAPDAMTRSLTDRVRRTLDRALDIDARAIEAELYDAVRTHGDSRVVEAFVFPLLRELGSRWQEGTAGIAEEHVVAGVVRSYLSSRLRDVVPPADAPRLIVGALEGENHDIGALAGAVRAHEAGWQAVFLGANTPTDSIVTVARRIGAQAVLVVITMEESEATVKQQIERLAAGAPVGTKRALAGHVSDNVAIYAEQLGFTVLQSMAHLDQFMAEARPK